jgi:LysM repeat protein
MPSPPAAGSTAGITAAAAGAGAAIGASLADAAPSGPAQPPVYLTAESAPPPTHDPGGTPAAQPDPVDATSRPDRYATLSAPQPPATTPLQPETLPTPPPAAGSPAAFATAWADAHDKLAAGRYAEALAALSVWYDDPSLGLEESQRLEDLLGQLAGTVIYSQQDLLLPPHVVAPGETLQSIALPLGIAPQLLGKINGVDDPLRLVPGEHLKVIRGPFDAVVSVSRRRLSLQLGGSYAGSFPVVVGRQFLTRVGSSIAVVEASRGPDDGVLAVGGTSPAPPATKPAIILDGGLIIEAADDPGVVSDTSPTTSLVVSVRDLAELLDLLAPGSKVLIRQ